jgi:hypothetical protein
MGIKYNPFVFMRRYEKYVKIIGGKGGPGIKGVPGMQFVDTASCSDLEFILSTDFMDWIPEEIVAHMLHGFLRGSLLPLRCVSRRWNAAILHAISLCGSLRVRKVPLESLALYEGAVAYDLSYSYMGDSCIESVRSAVANARVTTLDLRYNEISYQGARALRDVLEANNTIAMLNFHNNRIGDDGTRFLADLVTLKSCIHTLVLSSNSINERGIFPYDKITLTLLKWYYEQYVTKV